MPTAYKGVHAVCPFYKHDAKQMIKCEGIVYGATITMWFCDISSKDLHKTVFCDDKFGNCELYNAIINAKYQD